MSVSWRSGADYQDIRYELSTGDDAGIAKITINRPEVRNAFRPETVIELSDAFERAREDLEVGVVILTGEGPDAFCSGGDQRVRGSRGGYVTGADPADGRRPSGGWPLSRHRPPRADPAAAQAGRGDGRGLCGRRWSCAARRLRPDDRRGQRALRSDRAEGRLVRWRFGRERTCRAHRRARRRPRRSGSSADSTTRREALEMGLVNTVVPLDQLEEETVSWCREMLALSPFALRFLKAASTPTRTVSPGSSSSPTTPTSSST